MYAAVHAFWRRCPRAAGLSLPTHASLTLPGSVALFVSAQIKKHLPTIQFLLKDPDVSIRKVGVATLKIRLLLPSMQRATEPAPLSALSLTCLVLPSLCHCLWNSGLPVFVPVVACSARWICCTWCATRPTPPKSWPVGARANLSFFTAAPLPSLFAAFRALSCLGGSAQLQSGWYLAHSRLLCVCLVAQRCSSIC